VARVPGRFLLRLRLLPAIHAITEKGLLRGCVLLPASDIAGVHVTFLELVNAPHHLFSTALF